MFPRLATVCCFLPQGHAITEEELSGDRSYASNPQKELDLRRRSCPLLYLIFVVSTVHGSRRGQMEEVHSERLVMANFNWHLDTTWNHLPRESQCGIVYIELAYGYIGGRLF